jgi:hypothetical protein
MRPVCTVGWTAAMTPAPCRPSPPPWGWGDCGISPTHRQANISTCMINASSTHRHRPYLCEPWGWGGLRHLTYAQASAHLEHMLTTCVTACLLDPWTMRTSQGWTQEGSISPFLWLTSLWKTILSDLRGTDRVACLGPSCLGAHQSRHMPQVGYARPKT